MVANSKIVAFAPAREAERAKHFYSEVLGLRLVSEDQWALQYDANGVTLRLQLANRFMPQPFTVLGWNVEDVSATMAELKGRGVVFERFGFVQQDANGVWTTPDGSKVAWFKDSEGNLLSVTELPK